MKHFRYPENVIFSPESGLCNTEEMLKFARNLLSHANQKSRRLFSHVPVMADEILELMRPEDGKVFIDMTFGAGGHSRKLLSTDKSIKIVAVDRDPAAIEKARELSKEIAAKSARLNINQSVIPIHGKFSTVLSKIHLSGIAYGSVDGVIFDLGASSIQYDDPKRGFSISSDTSLDMRMDTTDNSHITAEDVINNLDQDELMQIFKTYGEEKRSRKVAAAIMDARALLGRVKTTRELSRIVESVRRPSTDALKRPAHPATLTFQALRIFVNNELNELNYALVKVRDFLRLYEGEFKTLREDQKLTDIRGIAAVISFHSLEDRIVKRHFSGTDPDEPVIKRLTQHDRIQTNLPSTQRDIQMIGSIKNWTPIWKSVRIPSEREISANPRSRSAKLRAAVRIA